MGAKSDATSCLGPLGGLQDHRPIYAAAVAALRDPAVTMLALVTRPDHRALAAAADAARELADLDHEPAVVMSVAARTMHAVR